MDLTNDQIERIVDHSFIDKYDPNKHNLKKYKLVLIFGKCIINRYRSRWKMLIYSI